MGDVKLIDEQDIAFAKFRELASDYIQPHHEDYYLLKWLTEKCFDPQKAADMFCESMKWRIKHGIDDIVETWKPPMSYGIFSNRGIVGHNKFGSSVLLFPAGRWDLKGMLSSGPIEDIVMNLVYHLEKGALEEKMKKKKFGNVSSKQTVIVDFEGLDYTVAIWKTAWELVALITITFGSNYPQSINSMFVINAAAFIPPIFNTILPWLNSSIVKIIKIYSSDRSKWVPALLAEIDPSQLPKHWGGTMVDPDGDPRCPSKVCVHYVFPKSVYMKSVDATAKKKLKKAFVDICEIFQLDVHVPVDGSILRWMFYTDGFDIDFKIHYEDVDGTHEIVTLLRESCYFSMVEGETTTLKSGKYVVTFDNSYYKLKGKNVSYSISVISTKPLVT